MKPVTRLCRQSRITPFQTTGNGFKRQFFRTRQNDTVVDQFDLSDPQSKMQRVEAVLLISREPINTRQIAKLANLADGTESRSLIRLINKKYREVGRSFRIERVAGGYQMLTHEKIANWIRRLHGLNAAGRLSDPSLETLSIIAYRQPILRADIEQIRGVSCGEVLRQLMERKFVKISGRSEELGRPFLYSTTKFFLKYFGLDKIEDLPKSDYFRKTTVNSSPDPNQPFEFDTESESANADQDDEELELEDDELDEAIDDEEFDDDEYEYDEEVDDDNEDEEFEETEELDLEEEA